MTPINWPSISSISSGRNIPTPIIEDIPFNVDDETSLLNTLSQDFNLSPFRHQKVTAFQNLTIKFFQNISYLEVPNYQEKKKYAILLSETFQELLQEKRIIKQWKKLHLKKKLKTQVTSALSYFKTMKQMRLMVYVSSLN